MYVFFHLGLAIENPFTTEIDLKICPFWDSYSVENSYSVKSCQEFKKESIHYVTNLFMCLTNLNDYSGFHRNIPFTS